MPESLLMRIIAVSSNTGDCVFDPFIGSGTTAAVAQRLGRRFLAVDREPEAVAVCLARLAHQGRALAAAGTPPPPIVVSRACDEASPG